MRALLTRWAETARSVGAALLEVLAAEAGELQSDLQKSGRELRGALVLLGLAAGVAFWTIGLGIWLAVELLTLRFPAYGAALIVFAVGVSLCLLLFWLGKRRLRRLETPLDAVRRRTQSHAEWWQQTVLPEMGIETPAVDDDERLDEA